MRTTRLSREMIDAALRRGSSRLDRRFAAPRRLSFQLPAAANGSAREPRIIGKRAGGGEGDDGSLAVNDGGDGGRGAGAELQRIEHRAVVNGLQVHMRCDAPRAVAGHIPHVAHAR